MSGYIGNTPVPQATQTRNEFTATAGQTTFATSGYTAGFVDVHLNGVKLSSADFTATNGSDIVLVAPAALDDIVEVLAFTTFEVENLADVAQSGDYGDLINTPAPFDPNTLATVATTGSYSDLTGTPTLGTAAATASTDYATAAQGTLADSAVQPNDSPTFGAVTATSYAGDGSALTGISSAPSTSDVLTATASAGVGDVGTYAALQMTSNGAHSAGYTRAGSGLRYMNFFAYGNAGWQYSSPSGTWRLMGSTGYYAGGVNASTDRAGSVWLRIS